LRQIALAAVAVAVALSGAAFGTAASARNVCGMNGCAPVLVKRLQVPPRKITTNAAPLPVSNAPAAASASSGLPSLPSLSSLTSSALNLLQGK
jgi:hypothetical protein